MSMTYSVDYGTLDEYKRKAQVAAATTADQLKRFGFSEVSWSRGESVYLVQTPFGHLAFLVEGLGTKNLVADELYKLAAKIDALCGIPFYANVAQCNAAMSFNDMITLGASPIIFGQYLATGDAQWFKNKNRYEDLIEGTRRACELAGCSWGPGETPQLRGIIHPEAADLSGAAVGWIKAGRLTIDPRRIAHDDHIVLLGSSGIHANGLTMAREIAAKMHHGYLTSMPDGRTYGETLLDPTIIYVKLIEELLCEGVDIHYAVNITGHGWRKLMRAEGNFAYVIEHLPDRQPIFDFIQKHGKVEDREMFGTFNMGAGFALYMSDEALTRALKIFGRHSIKATIGGHIERAKKKRVEIKPIKITYESDTLQVR